MSVIQDKARDVLAGMGSASPKPQAVAGIDIGSIISIITSLLQMFLNCNKSPAQAQKAMKHQGPLERLRIRQAAGDRFGSINMTLMNRLVASISGVAAKTSVKEVASMMTEIS